MTAGTGVLHTPVLTGILKTLVNVLLSSMQQFQIYIEHVSKVTPDGGFIGKLEIM